MVNRLLGYILWADFSSALLPPLKARLQLPPLGYQGHQPSGHTSIFSCSATPLPQLFQHEVAGLCHTGRKWVWLQHRENAPLTLLDSKGHGRPPSRHGLSRRELTVLLQHWNAGKKKREMPTNKATTYPHRQVGGMLIVLSHTSAMWDNPPCYS